MRYNDKVIHLTKTDKITSLFFFYLYYFYHGTNLSNFYKFLTYKNMAYKVVVTVFHYRRIGLIFMIFMNTFFQIFINIVWSEISFFLSKEWKFIMRRCRGKDVPIPQYFFFIVRLVLARDSCHLLKMAGTSLPKKYFSVELAHFSA